MITLLQYVKSDPSLSIAPTDCNFEHYVEVRENRKLGTNKYSKEYRELDTKLQGLNWTIDLME